MLFVEDAYFTVSAMVDVCVMLPAVAVMLMLDVPAGVNGVAGVEVVVVGLVLLLLQPVMSVAVASMKTAKPKMRMAACLRWRPMKAARGMRQAATMLVGRPNGTSADVALVV